MQKEILRKTPLLVGLDNWMASVMIRLSHKKLTEIDITRKMALFTNTATSHVFVIKMYLLSSYVYSCAVWVGSSIVFMYMYG